MLLDWLGNAGICDDRLFVPVSFPSQFFHM